MTAFATQIEVFTGPPDPRWDAFVDISPTASVYHAAVWQRVVAEVFGHETYYLMAVGSGNEGAKGVLPMVRICSRLFGDYMVSMPYFNYGGAVGDSPQVEKQLMQQASELATSLGVHHVEFRDTADRTLGWPARTNKVEMHLALPATADELWRGLGSKLRAQVKRPQRDGADVRRGGSELLSDFYRVFARNMRDLGTPVYTKRFFAAILEALPTQAEIALVRVRGEPAAAGFLLSFGDRVEIPWASSLREYNRIGVNMLMYWEALRGAVEAGRRVFDFGRSTLDSGTFRFKRQWGAEPVQLHWHYFLPKGGELPHLDPENPKYALAIRAWQRLPLWFANWLGPRIVRSLP